MKKHQWFAELFVFLLALLFFYTALSKLLDFRHFIRAINNQPFDNRFTPFLVYFIPGIELLTTALLLYIKTRSVGLYASAALMGIFSGYVALVTFHFYDRVPCGCAGVFEHIGWPAHLLLNLVFFAMAITAIWLEQKLKNSWASA